MNLCQEILKDLRSIRSAMALDTARGASQRVLDLYAAREEVLVRALAWALTEARLKTAGDQPVEKVGIDEALRWVEENIEPQKGEGNG